jgi:hypothetical protein
MGTATAQMMLVFGDVRQVGKVTERPHHLTGVFSWQGVEQGFKFRPGRGVVVPMVADRQKANAFDRTEHLGALLIGHRFAQQATQQSDVIT